MARIVNWNASDLENRVLVECAYCARPLGTTPSCPSCSASRHFRSPVPRPRTLAGRIRAAWKNL